MLSLIEYWHGGVLISMYHAQPYTRDCKALIMHTFIQYFLFHYMEPGTHVHRLKFACAFLHTCIVSVQICSIPASLSDEQKPKEAGLTSAGQGDAGRMQEFSKGGGHHRGWVREGDVPPPARSAEAFEITD